MIFSISDLQKFSGVQPQTIRMWEKRYNALQPIRSEGNTRYYDDDQLKRLLNIVSLNQAGLKISRICKLSNDEIHQMLGREIYKSTSNDKQIEYFISQLIHYALDYDGYTIDKILSDCIDQFGIQTTYKRIIYPLLIRVGLMWCQDSICPAQEHFLSGFIRQKLFTAINNIDAIPGSLDPTWLLFLPEDESHDIGLLFAHYLLRKSNQRVIYLGANVPFESLQEVMQNQQIEHMLFFFIRVRPVSEAEQYLKRLRNTFKNASIYFSGNPKLIHDLQFDPPINRLKTVEEFEAAIERTKIQNG
jgi:MerR family transcriptional regulator, light-induced transcriptional regulator